MAPYVFALRAGIPALTFRSGPSFGRRQALSESVYKLIEDEDTVARLKAKEVGGRSAFRYLEPDELETALGSAADAVEAIEAGEHDDVLDLLLFAEREVYDGRVTVIDAIADRNREIKEELGIHIDIQEKVGVYHHAYTHYKITLHAFLCTLRTSDIQLTFHTSWTWSPLSELEEYPMGKLDRLISRKLQADHTPEC